MQLIDQPAYWINMDDHRDRADSFLESTAKYWLNSLTRISGVDGQLFDDADIVEFVNKRRGAVEKPSRPKHSEYTMKINRGTLGCLQSHITALARGIEDAKLEGFGSFVILEDDAALRMELLERTPLPPEEAEFIGWGGTMMLSFKSDDAMFERNSKQAWNALSLKSRFYGTHCYQVTINAAEQLLELYRRGTMSADDAWHDLFGQVQSVRPRIQVVTQRAGVVSAINGKSRDFGIV